MKKEASNPAVFSPTFLIPVFWVLSLIWSISWFEPHAVLRLASIGFCFLAAMLSLGQGLKEGFYRPHGMAVIILLLFWILVGASILWSDIPYVSFIAFCAFSFMPLTFFALVTSQDALYLLRRCSFFALMFGAVLALGVIIQFFFMPDMLVSGGVRFPFANPNSFAGFLSLCLFGALAWMVTAEDKKYSNMAFVFSALYVMALITLAGRGALLGLALGLSVFLFCVGKATIKKHKRCLGGLLGIGLTAFVLNALMGASRTTVLERFGQIGEKGEQIVTGRTDIWRATWTMIEQHMLTGTGIGTFFLYYPEYRLPSDWYSGGYMAHNDPLQFWMEMGILAPFLFYAALFFVLVRSISAIKAAKPDDERRVYLLASVCGMGVFVLHTHITFHFYVGALLLLFGLALAWWYVLVNGITGQADKLVKGPSRWPVAVVLPAALLPFFALYFVLQGFLFSEFYVDRARVRMAAGDAGGFAEDINRADRAGFGRNARAYIQAAAIPLGILDAENATLPEGERKALEKQINSLLDKAGRYNPRLVGIPYYRAMLAGYRQRSDNEIPDNEIKGYLQRAVKLNPQHLPSRLMLMDFYIGRGKRDEALTIGKEGLGWRYAVHDPVPYYMRLIELLAGTGEKEVLAEVRQKLEAALVRQKLWRKEHQKNGVIPLSEHDPDGPALAP